MLLQASQGVEHPPHVSGRFPTEPTPLSPSQTHPDPMTDGTLTLDKDAFKALSSDTRVAILKALDQRQMTVSELSRELDLHKATVFEHLERLQTTRLVERWESDRKWVYYALTWRGRRVLHPEKINIALLLSTAGASIAAGLVALWVHLTTAAPSPRTESGASQPMADAAGDAAAPAAEMAAQASLELALAVALLLLAVVLVAGAWEHRARLGAEPSARAGPGTGA